MQQQLIIIAELADEFERQGNVVAGRLLTQAMAKIKDSWQETIEFEVQSRLKRLGDPQRAIQSAIEDAERLERTCIGAEKRQNGELAMKLKERAKMMRKVVQKLEAMVI